MNNLPQHFKKMPIQFCKRKISKGLTVGILLLIGFLLTGCVDPKYHGSQDASIDSTDTNNGTNTDTGADSDTDTDTDIDTDTDANIDTDTNTGTDADIDNNVDTDSDVDTDGDTSTDTDTHADTDTPTVTATDLDIDVDTDTDLDGGTDIDSGTDTYTDSNTDTGTDADTDSNTGSDTDIDTGCQSGVCEGSLYCNANGNVACTDMCGDTIVMEDCVSSEQHGTCNGGVCGCTSGFGGADCQSCVVTNGGVESCDGMDNDCDGVVDDVTESACPICQDCSDGNCVDVADNTQDVGCEGTCEACHSGSCGNATNGTDPGNYCTVTAAGAPPPCQTGQCQAGACAAETGAEITCYQDQDDDGWCLNSTATRCASCPTGWRLLSQCNENGSRWDCDDTNPSVYPRLCYPDGDDDQHGDENGSGSWECQPDTVTYPTGCSSIRHPSNDDCDDDDPDVHSGQTLYFFTARDEGTGNFDYDCDGLEVKRSVTKILSCSGSCPDSCTTATSEVGPPAEACGELYGSTYCACNPDDCVVAQTMGMVECH